MKGKNDETPFETGPQLRTQQRAALFSLPSGHEEDKAVRCCVPPDNGNLSCGDSDESLKLSLFDVVKAFVAGNTAKGSPM